VESDGRSVLLGGMGLSFPSLGRVLLDACGRHRELRSGLDRCRTVLWSGSGEPYVIVPPLQLAAWGMGRRLYSLGSCGRGVV